MAKCKACRGCDTFVFVTEMENYNLYQCANCKRVVRATPEELNEEHYVI